MDKDNYTRELLLQTTDICFISYACQLGRVKGVILELEEKRSSRSESDARKAENEGKRSSDSEGGA